MYPLHFALYKPLSADCLLLVTSKAEWLVENKTFPAVKEGHPLQQPTNLSIISDQAWAYYALLHTVSFFPNFPKIHTNYTKEHSHHAPHFITTKSPVAMRNLAFICQVRRSREFYFAQEENDLSINFWAMFNQLFYLALRPDADIYWGATTTITTTTST